MSQYPMNQNEDHARLHQNMRAMAEKAHREIGAHPGQQNDPDADGDQDAPGEPDTDPGQEG